MDKKNEPQNKKTEIFLAADRLFYEKGYNATTFDAIAEICNVTKPLITFHYKRKAILANEIGIAHNKKRKNVIAEKLYLHYGVYDLQVATAMENKLYLMQMNEDRKVYRFFSERINADFNMFATVQDTPMFSSCERKYNLKFNDEIDEMKMTALSWKGAFASLIVSYFNNEIDCSFNDFSDYVTKIPFQYMKIPEDEIEKIIKTAKETIAELDFKFGPYFEIY